MFDVIIIVLLLMINIFIDEFIFIVQLHLIYYIIFTLIYNYYYIISIDKIFFIINMILF